MRLELFMNMEKHVYIRTYMFVIVILVFMKFRETCRSSDEGTVGNQRCPYIVFKNYVNVWLPVRNLLYLLPKWQTLGWLSYSSLKLAFSSLASNIEPTESI